MKTEIVTIGNELLIGKTQDTNAGFIAKELTAIGLQVGRITTISDSPHEIIEFLKSASTVPKIIVMTGGLGPTSDDITKKTLTDFFEDELILNSEVLVHIEEMFAYRYNSPINQGNRDQALLPSRATIFKNRYGTASGMWFENDKVVCISLPGVPHEMRYLLTNSIIPAIQNKFTLPYNHIRTIHTAGLGESNIATRLSAWENRLPDHVQLAYLPNLGKVKIRISATHSQSQKAIESVETAIEELLPLISDIYYGQNDVGLVQNVANLLSKSSKTISCAESYTGGALSKTFTSIPGSSKYFIGSIVSYAKKIKENLLQVSQSHIEEYGVVNEEVARQMVVGALKQFKTDLAVATTGNAGPTRGDNNVEVGTVFIAIGCQQKIDVHQFKMNGPRQQVIQRSINKIFELLYHKIVDTKTY